MYDKLVTKVNKIDTSGFLSKTKYQIHKSDLENKTPAFSVFVKKIYYSTEISEIEGKIPSIIGLANSFALTAVEDKIPDVSSLVKKRDCNTKISKIVKKLTNHNHDKTITSQEFNKLTTENFSARLKQANLVIKTDFDDKLKSLNQKINSNKTKCLLVEKELKNYKQLFQFILEEKVISKKMVHKVI